LKTQKQKKIIFQLKNLQKLLNHAERVADVLVGVSDGEK
jgi:hypothetical protein